MAYLNFPTNPSPGDYYTLNAKTWMWNGSVWQSATPVDISVGVIGALAVSNGGTGLVSTGASGNVLTSNGTYWVSSSPEVTSNNTVTLTNKTITGTKETRVNMPANDVNLSSGNFFTKTISTTTTFTVSNVPSTGTAVSFILDLTNGGSATVNWWTGVKWASGTAPTLTAAGRDVLGFFTHDGGTTWTGLVLGKDVK